MNANNLIGSRKHKVSQGRYEVILSPIKGPLLNSRTPHVYSSFVRTLANWEGTPSPALAGLCQSSITI